MTDAARSLAEPARFRDAVVAAIAGDAAAREAARALAPRISTAVLVEGTSDVAAVETLARRRGQDLATGGVAVIPLGGATSILRFLQLVGPSGLGVRVAGLCDAGEEPFFRRAAIRVGLGDVESRDVLESL